MYSSRFETALCLAGVRHAGQIRKGSGAPYLTHLAHVAAILARAGYDEDTQIVGLLHDIIEDTTSSVTEGAALADELRDRFGSSVADAIVTLTEPKYAPDGQKLAWQYRKERYLAQLAAGDDRSLRVSAADKLHNLANLADELAVEGDAVWDRFKPGPDESFWFYRRVYEVISERVNEPLIAALRQQMERMHII